MRYIDFDGVILDTEEILFYKWRLNENRHLLSEIDKVKYIQESNWEEIIYSSKELDDALFILRNSRVDDYTILTKVHSLENEAYYKIKFLREKKIKQNIIIVPYLLKKTDVVNALGNTLVDDSISNLIDFENAGGYGLFYDIDNDNIDPWGISNDKPFQRVKRINERRK